MQAKGQHKILISAPRDTDREMIVNAFFKAIQDGHAQCGGQMDFDLLNGILSTGCVNGVNRHKTSNRRVKVQ